MGDYSTVGRLAPHYWTLYDDQGNIRGSGAEAAPIVLCGDCGCIVANEVLHDLWHENEAARTGGSE